MRRLWFIPCFVLLSVGTACTFTPTSLPMPTSTPTPMQPLATLTPASLSSPSPEVVAANFPSHIPACPGFKAMDTPLKFIWPSIENAMEPAWLHYRCVASPTHLETLYRKQMTEPPYNWLEATWVVRAEGTMGVYFQTTREGWLYLWFLTDGSATETSILVIGEREDAPLEMECH